TARNRMVRGSNPARRRSKRDAVQRQSTRPHTARNPNMAAFAPGYTSSPLNLKRRMSTALFIFVAGFGLLVGRLVWLQGIRQPYLARLAAMIHVRKLPI